MTCREEESEEVMTQEEFERHCEEWKARGPFSAQLEVRTWLDFTGHERNRVQFVVLDSAGVRVGIAAERSQAERWATELTLNGYIED